VTRLFIALGAALSLLTAWLLTSFWRAGAFWRRGSRLTDPTTCRPAPGPEQDPDHERKVKAIEERTQRREEAIKCEADQARRRIQTRYHKGRPR
jgi:hypothetical protein